MVMTDRDEQDEKPPVQERRRSNDRRSDDRRLDERRRAGIGEVMDDRRKRPRRRVERRDSSERRD
jgi:hypothetical protein